MPTSFELISLKHVQERHKFFIELSLAQTGMVHTEEEIDYHTMETEAKISDFLRNSRGLWLVAIEQNQIVGEVDITVKNLSRIKHNGRLTIGVLPKHQSMGLGSALMEKALLWAREHKLLRIELDVFASNTKARKLYEKFGFVIEGRRKNFLHQKNDLFEDDILMAKYL